MDKNRKAGLIVIFTIVALITILVVYADYLRKKNNYELNFVFPKANGLQERNTINYLGVEIGEVRKIETKQENIIANALIERKVRIPKGSKIQMTNYGLFDGKRVDISPSSSKEYYESGDTIYHTEMDTIPYIAKIGKAANIISDVGGLLLQSEISIKLDTVINLLREQQELLYDLKEEKK